MTAQFLQITPVVDQGQNKLKLCHGTNCGTSNGTYPTVDLGYDSGGHTFVVSINDPTHQYTFTNDPIWVQRGYGSPPQKIMDSKGQIPNVIKANDQTIIFDDLNDERLTLGYRLNLNGPSGSLSIDPAIKNGGGTTSVYSALQVATLAIGVASLVAILFVAYQQWALRRR